MPVPVSGRLPSGSVTHGHGEHGLILFVALLSQFELQDIVVVVDGNGKVYVKDPLSDDVDPFDDGYPSGSGQEPTPHEPSAHSPGRGFM